MIANGPEATDGDDPKAGDRDEKCEGPATGTRS